MKRTKLAALAASSVLALAACGNHTSADDYTERPTAWGPVNAAGQAAVVATVVLLILVAVFITTYH